MAPSEPAVHVEGLRKVYGDFIAVHGSSFDVSSGEVFGIVGPNGAGKTTTLKMLSGLIEPTSGTATVAGHDVTEREMRQFLGFLPEESPLYEEMTARSYLNFFADLYNVSDADASERIESTLDRLDLDRRDTPIGNMSKGMKRKVAIARSLINDPDVVVYDEPASGLDPKTTNHIIEFIRELCEQGTTVLFSAHNLYHVEDVCDRVALMTEGNIVAQGSVEALREKYADERITVELTAKVAGAERTRANTYTLTIDDFDEVEPLRQRVNEAGGRIADVNTDRTSLEEIFLALTDEDESAPEHRRVSAASSASPATTESQQD